MRINSDFIRFSLIIIVVLVIAFVIQILIQESLGYGRFDGLIIYTYSFNIILTLVSFFVIDRLRKKRSGQIGFIFLGLSIFKFILFLTILRPQMDLENGVKSLEFSTFFIPYAICTTTEVLYLVRLLRN